MDDARIVGAQAGLSFEDGADRARIIISSAQTDGRYALLEWVVAPATSLDGVGDFGPHRHFETEETFFVREGRLEFLLDETVVTLGRGDCVRVPPGTRHGFRNVSDRAVELLVGFYPGGLETLFVKHRGDQTPPPAPGACIEEAERLYASVFETTPSVS